jgi:hypothetical protein
MSQDALLQDIEQLVKLVERESKLYEDLLSSTLRQREALIHNVEADISATAAEQDRLLRQVSATEKSSLAVAARCARQMELPAEEPGIAEIAERAGEPHSGRLIGAAQHLLKTGTRVRGENMINRHLLNNLLELTDFCLRSVVGRGAPSAYRIDGSSPRHLQSLALDSKV